MTGAAPREPGSRPKPGSPRNGRRQARTSPGGCPSGPFRAVVGGRPALPPEHFGHGAKMQERLMCSTRIQGSSCGNTATTWSTATCRRIGLRGPHRPLTRQRQHLRDQRRRLADVAVKATASCSGNARSRRSSAWDDARRPDVVADHVARRSGDRERPDVRVGTARPAARIASSPSTRRPVHQPRQRAGRQADRHDLRQSVRRRRQWRPHVLLGRQRRAMHAVKVNTGEPICNWRVSSAASTPLPWCSAPT